MQSPLFRHGHVETFQVSDRFSILHVCVIPHVDDPAPIFGYDIIAGPTKITGLFLDLTSVIASSKSEILSDLMASSAILFPNRRTLPDWGDVFSPDMLAIRPGNETELTAANDIAMRALDTLLRRAPQRRSRLREQIQRGQSRYIAAQRRNEHTFRMLAGFVGADRARSFIEDVLFPDVPACPEQV